MIAGKRVCARSLVRNHSMARCYQLKSSTGEQQKPHTHTLALNGPLRLVRAHIPRWRFCSLCVSKYFFCSSSLSQSVHSFCSIRLFVCLLTRLFFLALYKNHRRNTLRLFDCWRLLYIGFAITKMRNEKTKQQKHTSAAAPAATTILANVLSTLMWYTGFSAALRQHTTNWNFAIEMLRCFYAQSFHTSQHGNFFFCLPLCFASHKI